MIRVSLWFEHSKNSRDKGAAQGPSCSTAHVGGPVQGAEGARQGCG